MKIIKIIRDTKKDKKRSNAYYEKDRTWFNFNLGGWIIASIFAFLIIVGFITA